MSIGELIEQLGDRSFGWCILLFGLVNLVPMPIGSNMITGVPLILLTAQMAFGKTHVWMPEFITRRHVRRASFQRVVLRLRPIIGSIERMIRPRYSTLFAPPYERIMGVVLLATSLALFAPIPLSGFIPATALFIAGFGLVERDGLVTLIGLGLGLASVVITIVVAVFLFLGAQALA